MLGGGLGKGVTIGAVVLGDKEEEALRGIGRQGRVDNEYSVHWVKGMSARARLS